MHYCSILSRAANFACKGHRTNISTVSLIGDTSPYLSTTYIVHSIPPFSSARVLEPMIALEWEQNDFVQNSGVRGCTDEWTLWPEVHKAAIENWTILLFRLFPSVGNLFLALHNIIKVMLYATKFSKSDLHNTNHFFPRGYSVIGYSRRITGLSA